MSACELNLVQSWELERWLRSDPVSLYRRAMARGYDPCRGAKELDIRFRRKAKTDRRRKYDPWRQEAL